MLSATPMFSAFAGAGGSFFHSLTGRQISPREVLEYPYLGKWRSDGSIPNSGVITIEPIWGAGQPLAVSFTKERGNGHYLAAGDEFGYVRIFNTSQPFTGRVYSREESLMNGEIAEWLARLGAVFEISWIKEDTFMLTGSRDQIIKVWDIERKTNVGVMKGHTGSVRSLSVNLTQPDIFVSGSFDGSFAFWDIRTPAVHRDPNYSSYGPVAKVEDAHKALNAKCHFHQEFIYLQDATTVVSSGGNGMVVKYWDTRMLTAPVAQTPPRVPEAYVRWINVQGCGVHGTAGLSQDSTGTRLIVSTYVDPKIYMYDVMRPEKCALRTFTGHVADSRYIKAAFSPDGNHVFSGSSDHNAYIWKVHDPKGSPTVLEGHDAGITDVSWCHTDFCKVATCAVDGTVRIWALSKPQFGQRVIKDSLKRAQPFRGGTDAFTTASPVSPLESLPPSTLRGELQEELRLKPNGFEGTLQTTDTAILGFGTSHKSSNNEATLSKKLKVSQNSPVGKGKENMAVEDQQELGSPELKTSSSHFSVFSPPGSISSRRKIMEDDFEVQPQSSEASAINNDSESRDSSSMPPVRKGVRRVLSFVKSNK